MSSERSRITNDEETSRPSSSLRPENRISFEINSSILCVSFLIFSLHFHGHFQAHPSLSTLFFYLRNVSWNIEATTLLLNSSTENPTWMSSSSSTICIKLFITTIIGGSFYWKLINYKCESFLKRKKRWKIKDWNYLYKTKIEDIFITCLMNWSQIF